MGLIWFEFQKCEQLLFYQLAGELTFEKDEFFRKYLEYIDSPSVEKFIKIS